MMDEQEQKCKRVRALLGTKISPEHFEVFQDDDIEKLVAAGFTNARTLEAATKSSLMLALPGRPGLVALLLRAFKLCQPPICTLFLIPLLKVVEVPIAYFVLCASKYFDQSLSLLVLVSESVSCVLADYLGLWTNHRIWSR